MGFEVFAGVNFLTFQLTPIIACPLFPGYFRGKPAQLRKFKK
jgi:hypothetical protein